MEFHIFNLIINFFICECFYMNMIIQTKKFFKCNNISFGHCCKEISFLLSFFFWPHCAACRILVPRPGIEPGQLQWKRQVLITALPGSSQEIYFFLLFNKCWVPTLTCSSFDLPNWFSRSWGWQNFFYKGPVSKYFRHVSYMGPLSHFLFFSFLNNALKM